MEVMTFVSNSTSMLYLERVFNNDLGANDKGSVVRLLTLSLMLLVYQCYIPVYYESPSVVLGSESR